MDTFGHSHEVTILAGYNLSLAILRLHGWEEAKTLLRDSLLPAARRSLAADHVWTLNLATALAKDPESTRGDPRLKQRKTGRGDAVSRRRRPARSRDHAAGRGPEAAILGPAHPDTLNAEDALSNASWHLQHDPRLAPAPTALSVGAIKARLRAKGVDYRGCVEKRDLVALLEAAERG